MTEHVLKAPTPASRIASTVRPRLIPVLLLKHGVIVRSQLFRVHQVIGNPMSTVERYSNWNADELVILDISRGEGRHDLRRDDIQQSYAGDSAIDVLRAIAEVCFMPLTFGGRIRGIRDIEVRLAAGADKVTLNTAAFEDPKFVEQAARRFGSQCIVASIDARVGGAGGWTVFVDGGRHDTGLDPAQWAREMENRGVGEILLNSIDRDGSATGYDIPLIRHVTEAVEVPVIACGGVGTNDHFATAIHDGNAAAAAAANIFHFFELSYPRAKQAAIDAGVPMRPVRLGSHLLAREPLYDKVRQDARLAERLRQARDDDFVAARPSDRRRPIRWCSTCVYPSISAAPMEFDEEGVCTGCQMAKVKAAIPAGEWERRKGLLRDLLERYRCRDGSRHDVVVAVSGGKDSYFQVHVLKEEFGLRPLLVTYDGNNWTDVGWRNMVRMRDVFDVDHVVVRPSATTLRKLNRLAFMIMGDMNWHAHVGIMTVPMAVAVERRIPLVFYGEHGYLDLCGQFSMDDFPEVTYRDRLEHFARGYEWTYFVGREGLTAQDLTLWKYPSDREIFDLDLRGIFLGNYVYWEANEHIKLVTERYGFEVSEAPFDRTYRTMSNLDDMHENGAHDYLKFIKFGYGRCTDHTCKDIRAGLMSRAQAIDLVAKYDPVKPRDLARWLAYTGMSEAEFDRIADTFRDPRVWWREGSRWMKSDIVRNRK
jgi:imidazoleglycerol phosphate synthase cyclase subunit